jgi:hypothetical protein
MVLNCGANSALTTVGSFSSAVFKAAGFTSTIFQ